MDCRLCCVVDGGKGPASESEFLGSICNLVADDDGTPAVFPVSKRNDTSLPDGCPSLRPDPSWGFYGFDRNKQFPLSNSFPRVMNMEKRNFAVCSPRRKWTRILCTTDCSHWKRTLISRPSQSFKRCLECTALVGFQNEYNTAVRKTVCWVWSKNDCSTKMCGMATRNLKTFGSFRLASTTQRTIQKTLGFWSKTCARTSASPRPYTQGQCHQEHDRLWSMAYVATLDKLQERIQKKGTPTSWEERFDFADFVLWISPCGAWI